MCIVRIRVLSNLYNVNVYTESFNTLAIYFFVKFSFEFLDFKYF